VNVYVNGAPVSHRPFREEEYGPLMRPQGDGVRRVFLYVEPLEPCVGGDDVTCDGVPADIDEIWVRVPCSINENPLTGNMRIHP